MRVILRMLALGWLFVLAACSNELLSSVAKADLKVSPSEKVTVGEHFTVDASESNFDTITWYVNGDVEARCDGASSCDFVYAEPGTYKIGIVVKAKPDASLIPGANIETKDSKEVTVTVNPAASPVQSNTTVVVSPRLTNVTAGSLVIRLTGTALPTSGMVITIEGETCGNWKYVSSFTQVSSELLFDAPVGCLLVTTSQISRLNFNLSVYHGTVVRVQNNNGGNQYTTLATGTVGP